MARLVRSSAALTLLVLCLLQLWRPYFFLTDDNLVGWLPIVVDVGRHLTRGEDFTTLHTLYGGNYRLLQDPAALCLWNPLTLGLSVVAQTPAYLAVADIFVGINLLGCAVATTLFLAMLRRHYGLPVSDRRILFFSLSYTFSAYALLIYPSWLTFAANQAALPIWGLGLLCRDRERGMLLVCLGFLVSILVGHLSPFLYAALFMTVAALGLSRAKGSWEPLGRWCCGGLAAFLLTSPLLWQALQGFSGQQRESASHLQQQFLGAIPFPTLVGSLLGGTFSALGGPFQIIGLNPGASFAIATSAVSLWSFIPGHFSAQRRPFWEPERWRASLREERNALAVIFFCCFLLVGLFLVRPAFLQAMVEQLPLYKSLRFAFRETYVFLFFFHVWLFLKRDTATVRASRLAMVGGVVLLAGSLLPWGPPSLLPATPDRQLLINGEAHAFWRKLKAELPPHTRIIPSINPRLIATAEGYAKLPQTLVGSSNFPALFDVDSLSGYHILGFGASREEMGVPGPQGLWAPEKARKLMRTHPNAVILRISSLEPLVMELETRRGMRQLAIPAPLETEPSLFPKGENHQTNLRRHSLPRRWAQRTPDHP